VTTTPSRNPFTAGMLWIRKRADVSGDASTSTLASTKPPVCSSASRSRIGPRVRQGPHQGAQKSTTTGMVAERTMTS
jgi:hypothetical protein